MKASGLLLGLLLGVVCYVACRARQRGNDGLTVQERQRLAYEYRTFGGGRKALAPDELVRINQAIYSKGLSVEKQ